jgi:hypothetical protein
MMSTTHTAAFAFTRTHARHLASKVAGDLRQMQIFYEKPSDTEIEEYMTELTELLAGAFLDSVEYGFRDASGWILAVRYVVRADGTLVADDRSGRIAIGVDISNAHWYSYLRLSAKWGVLSENERERMERAIPVKRLAQPEPKVGHGSWMQQKTYLSNGVGMVRYGFQKL